MTPRLLVGRLVGRHNWHRPSPGKTWEGFVGGTTPGSLPHFFALYDDRLLSIPRPSRSALAIALAGAAGTSSSPR